MIVSIGFVTSFMETYLVYSVESLGSLRFFYFLRSCLQNKQWVLVLHFFSFLIMYIELGNTWLHWFWKRIKIIVCCRFCVFSNGMAFSVFGFNTTKFYRNLEPFPILEVLFWSRHIIFRSNYTFLTFKKKKFNISCT